MTKGNQITENDNMAISGILSTQILMDMFVFPGTILSKRHKCISIVQ